MTSAIGAFTLSFVVANRGISQFLNHEFFTGIARVLLYGLLALGVASLIVVFFFSSAETQRQRRAGVESIPLVVAIAGLQVTMLLIPLNLRTQGLSASTTQNIGFAFFFVIASGYLAYGFIQCVRSIRRFLALASGYLRVSLIVLIVSLGFLTIAALLQIGYVLTSLLGEVSILPVMRVSTILSLVGLVGFLLGISYPMIYSRTRAAIAAIRRRRRYRDLEPLWVLVTSAVPSVVLPGHGGDELRSSPAVLFERRIIEIRDGLTQLSPLLPDAFNDADEGERVALLRTAVERYREAGTSSGPVRDVLPADGSTLDDDAEPLLKLARAI